MREQLCDALVARAPAADMVFLTGDLGFMALEPLRQAMGSRFINAGVAEQNMMSVAAGLAAQQLDVWVYSIAPFCYARPFEQIRNDIAFHNLPVKLIGNGGGYGYGVMGPTHHAIEDYGILLTLPHMRAYVPAFDQDMDAVIARAGANAGPAYIRMGRGEPPAGYGVPAYAPWRQLCAGDGPVTVVAGPLAGTLIAPFAALPAARRPNLWVVGELPFALNPPPVELLTQLQRSADLCVVEEHVQHGSAGAALLLQLTTQGMTPRRFCHCFARAHHYERYGSQAWLRRQSGLDADSIVKTITGA